MQEPIQKRFNIDIHPGLVQNYR